ncbi:BTB/POZ protein [Microdochium trichocladiopsis]|uniref:BTB/POZ protein n=1 Tax=Microdochium trichocladiopsis TaxID=1682393 RepID=A0A9P9BPH6_9PEZI|nr:BTB/POZ protein [Microdochium trichocladiopsis]KAH7033144.1 BTB/POZ protein [Microdochium trichocladiopsis]
MSHLFGARDIELLESGEFADAIVECDGKSWRVHKAIVCKRSEWFRKALNGHFMEADLAKVTIREYTHERIEWILKWMYSGNNGLDNLGKLYGNPLTAAIEGYLTADYFMLDELKTAVADLLWANLADIIQAVQQFPSVECIRDHLLRHGNHSSVTFYRQFFEGVRLVYG